MDKTTKQIIREMAQSVVQRKLRGVHGPIFSDQGNIVGDIDPTGRTQLLAPEDSIHYDRRIDTMRDKYMRDYMNMPMAREWEANATQGTDPRPYQVILKKNPIIDRLLQIL